MITAPVNMDRRARRTAGQVLLGVVMLGLVMLAIWFVWLRDADGAAPSAPSGTRTETWYATTYGSDAGAIGDVLANEDCASLDAVLADAADVYFADERPAAERRASLGVMVASADRMNAVGCSLE